MTSPVSDTALTAAGRKRRHLTRAGIWTLAVAFSAVAIPSVLAQTTPAAPAPVTPPVQAQVQPAPAGAPSGQVNPAALPPPAVPATAPVAAPVAAAPAAPVPPTMPQTPTVAAPTPPSPTPLTVPVAPAQTAAPAPAPTGTGTATAPAPAPAAPTSAAPAPAPAAPAPTGTATAPVQPGAPLQASEPVQSRADEVETGQGVTVRDLNAPAAQPAIDESALRYFIQTGNIDKAREETERLRRLYPNWVPPNFEAVRREANTLGGPDETELWDLFRAGDYEGVERRIAERQAANSAYRPSEELTRQLASSKARVEFLQASEAGDYPLVIEVARANPMLLDCDNVDNIWRLAFAYGELGQTQPEFDLYSGVIKQCPTEKERFDTLLKARIHMTVDQMEQLIGMEEANPISADQRRDLAQLRLEIGRSLVVDALNQTGTAEDAPAPEIQIANLEQLETDTLAARDAANATLLGWYYYRRADYERAEEWFNHAKEWGGTEDSDQGLALTLVRRDRADEAEALAYASRDEKNGDTTYAAVVGEMLGEGVDPKSVDAEALQRAKDQAEESKNAALARALGWFEYRQKRYASSEDWFEKSLAWGGNDANDDSAAEGLMLSYLNQRKLKDAQRIRDEWQDRAPRLTELYRTVTAPGAGGGGGPARPAPPSAGQLMSQALNQQRYDDCIAIAAKARGGRGYTAGVSNILGFCLLEMRRFTEAQIAFEEALRLPRGQGESNVESDSVYGRSLAQLNRGLPSAAARDTEALSMGAQRTRELRSEVLAQQAVAASQRGDWFETLRLLNVRDEIARPRRDLQELRAWGMFNTNRRGEALKLFSDLDRVYSTESSRRGVATAGEGVYGFD